MCHQQHLIRKSEAGHVVRWMSSYRACPTSGHPSQPMGLEPILDGLCAARAPSHTQTDLQMLPRSELAVWSAPGRLQATEYILAC